MLIEDNMRKSYRVEPVEMCQGFAMDEEFIRR